jgi:riboflavin biosynthesis pyrimidine reductase
MPTVVCSRLLYAVLDRLTLGGATLAALLTALGLIDEYHLFVSPVVFGGDKRFLAGDTQVALHLLEARTFE